MIKNKLSTINFQCNVQNYSKQYNFVHKSLSNFQYSDSVSMKISVIHETRYSKSNGKFPVKIRFTSNKTHMLPHDFIVW